MSYQSYTIPALPPHDTITVKISETPGAKAENLPLSTWGSSTILAAQLHKIPFVPPPSSPAPTTLPTILPALELGAGTSLVGLSAAAIWRTAVIVTDLPGIVPGLTQNIAINADLLARHDASARCGSLDWARPDALILADGTSLGVEGHKARMILAADTIYDETHPGLLTGTVERWLEKGPEARFVLAYPERIAYLDYLREIWEILEKIGLECVMEGKEAGDGSFDDLAPYEWCVWRWKGLE